MQKMRALVAWLGGCALGLVLGCAMLLVQAEAAWADPLQPADGPTAAADGLLYWRSDDAIVRANYAAEAQEIVLEGQLLGNPQFDASGNLMYGIGSDGVIRRANTDGTGLTEILTPDDTPRVLRLVDGKLYWADTTRIRRANVDGSQVETLRSGVANLGGYLVDVDGGWLYWIVDMGSIVRAPLAGGDATTVYAADEETDGISCVAFDATEGKLYWRLNESSFSGPIQRIDGDGSNLETLPLEDICPRLDETTRKIYWFEYGPGSGDDSLLQADLDGTNVQTLAEDLNVPNSPRIDADGGKIYFYEAALNDSKIRRVNLTGGVAEDLVELHDSPSGLVLNLAQQQLFWTKRNVLYRANFDGSNEVTVVPGLRGPGGLLVDRAGKRIYWTANEGIYFAKSDGSDVAIFWENDAPSPSFVRAGATLLGIDEEAGKLYWMALVPTDEDPFASTTYRANLDGTVVETVGPRTLDGSIRADLPNSKLYGVRYDSSEFDSHVMRSDIDGSNVVSVTTVSLEIHGFAVDSVNGKLYWTVGVTEGRIEVFDLASSERSTLIDDINTPQQVHVDVAGGKIYWTSEPIDETPVLMRANLDGSEPESLLDARLSGLVFDPDGSSAPNDGGTPGGDGNTVYLPMLLKPD